MNPEPTPAPVPGLAVGSIVHYVMPPESRYPFACRPAIIVRIVNAVAGVVNLQVFTDGDDDGVTAAGETWWRQAVEYDPDSVQAGPRLGTWHFPAGTP